MRRFPAWPILAVLALLAATAFAADEGPAYSATDLAVEQESLPEGWEMVYDEVDDTPGEAIEEWANNVARTAGVNEGDLFYEIRVIKTADGPNATLLLIEVDGDPGQLPSRLEKAAQGEGWMARPMGHPTRLLVVAAPTSVREKLLDLQLRTSVKTLTRLAHERSEAGSIVGAEAYAQGALALEPKAGMPHAVLGLAAAKAEKWEEATEAFGRAFSPLALYPPDGELAHRSWRTYGYALLKLKKPEADKKAADALKSAIATADVLEGQHQVFAIHYNLACALTRLGKYDEACQSLEKALELAKVRLGPRGFAQYLNRNVMRDEDLDALRGKRCFDEVVKRVTEGVATSPLDGI